MSEEKTMISDTLPYEELKNRKIFFVICDVLSDELLAKLTKFTKHTGVEFMTENHDGFWVIKKAHKFEAMIDYEDYYSGDEDLKFEANSSEFLGHNHEN